VVAGCSSSIGCSSTGSSGWCVPALCGCNV
jgi:hypothetical protein